jgi:hypothetical protein
MKKKICFAFLAFFLIKGYASSVTLRGSITDISRSGTSPASINGVTVALTGATTMSFVTGASTFPAGHYEFFNLQPGRYTLTPSKTGYYFNPGNYSIFISSEITVDQNFNGSRYVFTGEWGSWGTDNGKFKRPAGVAVAFSTASFVYVADRLNNRVEVFDSTGGFVNKWGKLSSGNPPLPVSGTGSGEFNSPYGVAVDTSGNAYVADTLNHRVQKFTIDEEGNIADYAEWGVLGGAADTGTFNSPQGIAIDRFGPQVYVVDTNNNRIQVFSSTGMFINVFGSSGISDGEFNTPVAVAVDSEGNIYVADYNNYRIQKFDYYGTYVSQWGSNGTGDGSFNKPAGIAIDESDYVYVTDDSNCRVQKFDSAGNFITAWGYDDFGDGKFKHPSGISVAVSSAVYVADYDESSEFSRVQKFMPADSFVHIKGFLTLDTTAGVPINNVHMSLTCSVSTVTVAFITGPDGYYEFINLPSDGDYTVTPVKTGFSFNPPFLSTSALNENIEDRNFIGISGTGGLKYHIQGRITEKESDPPDAPIQDVLVTISGGASDTFLTIDWGDYDFTNLPAGGSYTVTPSKTGYGFTPPSYSTSSLSDDILNWDFKGYTVFGISGFVRDSRDNGIPDVAISVTGTSSTSTVTNSIGYYAVAGLAVNGTYTVRPSKLDYSFTPEFLDYQLVSDETGADFTARYTTPTITNLKIFGYVRDANGIGVVSASVEIASGTSTLSAVVTNDAGYYEFPDLMGRTNYTITPSKTNWGFTPASTTTLLGTADSELDFTGVYNPGVAGKIDIPLGTSGVPVTIALPQAGEAKLIVEERPDKKAKYRGTINPSKGEAVGIIFRPSVAVDSYIGKTYAIKIFTLKGELVEEFSKTPRTGDDIWIKWIPGNIASGIYIIYIDGPGVKSKKKLAVLK